MEKNTDLETKYQKLATEFSKVRSQATVLKKAVLDEQAKNVQLSDVIKKHEQTIRKHDQEMESLIFRNDQLAKRIAVLQQELQSNGSNKKGRSKGADTPTHSDFSVLDEELQKKILENAQLVSSMTDKEYELSECKEKIAWQDEKISSLEKTIEDIKQKHIEDVNKLKLQLESQSLNGNISNCDTLKELEEKVKLLQEEGNKSKAELDLLKSKPSSNEELTKYYEAQLQELFERKVLAESETKSLAAENSSLVARLESAILEHNQAIKSMEKSRDELLVTSENYKLQLDALTEHLAAQNEKITMQCDEIQVLKHKLASKK